jgi:hypothetical protein
MRETRVSRPSVLAAIRPTASAGDDNGVAPRMLTERSCASRADSSDRASVIVTAADDTAWAVYQPPGAGQLAVEILDVRQTLT